MGHNWDVENPNWQDFLNLSGWVQNPGSTAGLTLGQYTDANGTLHFTNQGWWRTDNNLASFAIDDYGMLKPHEDWSRAWQLYFRTPGTVTTADPGGNAVLTAKLQAVDAFFTSMMG
jgi:hypothetical protein